MANESRKRKRHNPGRLFELDGRHGLWSIPAWCRQMGISEPTYYTLEPRPHEAKIGKRGKRITEAPAAYNERVRQAEEQEAA